VAGSYEHGNETSAYENGGEFHDNLSHHQLFKKDTFSGDARFDSQLGQQLS
jgi:hypothetical protein